MEKLHSYQGWTGRLHEWRDSLRERYANYKDTPISESIMELARNMVKTDNSQDDYSHICRFVI